MHLVYTFSFVVVLVTLIATLSSSSVSLELVYRLQHIKAWLDPPVSSLPRRLLQFPNHWSTFRNAFPLSCPSCESCWYENHSFHPLLFENVSILQKSINYCHQNTLSLQWLKYNSRPSRSSKFLSNHHEYWVTWHSNSGKKLDFSNEKWDIYFRYHQAIIFKNESNEGVVPFVENGTQKRRRTSNMHRHGQVPFNVPTFLLEPPSLIALFIFQGPSSKTICWDNFTPLW